MDNPHSQVYRPGAMFEADRSLGHEVIVVNVRELRAISHSDRKSDQVDAEKLACFARLDPKNLRPIAHRMEPRGIIERTRALRLLW